MNVGLVSPYPPPGARHAQLSGVASYTKNLASSIMGQGDHNVSVFANRLGHTSQRYTEDGVDVTRCWDGGPRFPFQISRSVLRERNRLDLLHIQYEVFLYGGITSALAFPLLLALLRLSRIPVVITVHQVVPLTGVSKQFLKETGIKGKATILKGGLYLLVRSVVSLSSAVIVHEPIFKHSLTRQYKCNHEKIHVIPHGIEAVENDLDRAKARDVLDIDRERALLFFGYLARYKGLETLIDAFMGLEDGNYVLFIAGGEHPRLLGDPAYEEYIASLKSRAAGSSGRIRFTGFVPEDDIPFYFSACDVLVLPYTVMMSSSGPLSLCAAYKKPFLASESLADVVPQPDILFQNTPQGLRSKIEEFFNDEALQRQSIAYSERLLQQRSWSEVGRRTRLLYQEVTATK